MEHTSLASVGDEASLCGTSPILAVFKKAAKDLLERHDRHERINRLSRDITIESKRIISLLHTIVTNKESKENITSEAKKRLQKLINGPIKAIALETEHVSTYLHHKVFTAGLQEFVEARTFLSFIADRHIISSADIRQEMTYKVLSEDGSERTISTLLTPEDYILGLADLSGEVMKKAISGLSTNGADECFSDCEMLRKLYTGFLGLYGTNSMINNKLKMAYANVSKVERALCAYMVRGSEIIPKLANKQPQPRVASDDQSIEEDQGCY